MNTLNIFFIPSAYVGYKEQSVIKILYAFFFVRSVDPKKDAVTRFMIELSRQSNGMSFRLILPQYLCKILFNFLNKYKLSKSINLFFAHMDSGIYQKNIYSVMPMFYTDTFTISNR